MKTLNRYIVKEIAAPFFLSLFVFTFVLLLDRIMNLVELMVSRGVSILDIGALFIYILPSFLTLTIPMAFLLSVLLAFGRLSSESEFIAMKASGVSLYQMLIPVSILSIVAYALTFYIFIYALPWGNQSFRAKVFDIARGKASTGIKEGIFNDDFEGIVLYVDRMKDPGSKMEGVLIYDEREKDGLTIFAREGSIVSDQKAMTVTMRLRSGEIHKAGKELSYQRLGFSTYDLRLNFKDSSKKGEVSKGDREMTITELRERINELKGRGGDFKPYLVEIHKKFSIPFACIVFGLIGVPLGIQSRRGGRALGFTLSLGIFLIYYISLTGGENLADRGVIPPFLAMWGPNILFLLLGVYLIIKIGRDQTLSILVWTDTALNALENLSKRIFGRRD